MPRFQRVGRREGGEPLDSQYFNIWFLWYKDLVIWIWSWYLHWLQNANTLNLEVFNFITKNGWKTSIQNLKSWYFETSEDIMTKFKSQGLHIMCCTWIFITVFCLHSIDGELYGSERQVRLSLELHNDQHV